MNIFDIVHVFLGLGLAWQNDSRLRVFRRVVRRQNVLFINFFVCVSRNVRRGHHWRSWSDVESSIASIITPGGRRADFFDEELDFLSELWVVFEKREEVPSLNFSVGEDPVLIVEASVNVD